MYLGIHLDILGQVAGFLSNFATRLQNEPGSFPVGIKPLVKQARVQPKPKYAWLRHEH